MVSQDDHGMNKESTSNLGTTDQITMQDLVKVLESLPPAAPRKAYPVELGSEEHKFLEQECKPDYRLPNHSCYVFGAIVVQLVEIGVHMAQRTFTARRLEWSFWMMRYEAWQAKHSSQH